MSPEQASWIMISVLSFPIGIIIYIYSKKIKKILEPATTKEEIQNINKRINILESTSYGTSLDIIYVKKSLSDINNNISNINNNLNDNKNDNFTIASQLGKVIKDIELLNQDIGRIQKDHEFMMEV